MVTAEWVARYRYRILLAWGVLVAVLLKPALSLDAKLDVAARVARSESAQVDSLLSLRFASPYAHFGLLVVSGAPLPDESGGREVLDAIASRIGRVRGVLKVRAYESADDTLLLDRQARMLFVVAGLDRRGAPADAVILRLRGVTDTLRWQLNRTYPSVRLRWTGQDALNADMHRASTEDSRAAEERALPATLVVLIAGFGGLVAALLPVLGGTLAILLALGAAGVLSSFWPLSILVRSFVSMIGLGLGIDYALLSVSRFREELAAGHSVTRAAVGTARQAGHAILLSAAAVMIGFLGLLAVPVNEIRSVAAGGLLATAFAAAFACTLLPVLLAWMGPRIDAGALWARRAAVQGRAAWRRWSRWVTRHPIATLGLAGLPVIVLAWQGLRIRTGLPLGTDWLPAETESVQALHDLESTGREGVLQAVRLLVELPAGSEATTPAGWALLHRFDERLRSDRRIATVFSFAPLSESHPISRLLLLGVPREVRQTYLTADRRAVLIEAIPKPGTEPTQLSSLVDELRSERARTLAGLAGARMLVGGLPAGRAEYTHAIGERFPLVVLLIIAGTFVALAWGFGSVLIPVKAIALNLLSVGAGFGAVVLVFQEGHGVSWFGYSHPTGAVLALVPTLVFCTVFGLSMDYEVFILTRVVEARRSGLDEAAAVAEGLALSGPVVTSAAAIMVVVFGAFALSGFLVIQMLGLALAVAVLVDATIVRIALGPALLVLAGRWNWWPGDCPVAMRTA